MSDHEIPRGPREERRESSPDVLKALDAAVSAIYFRDDADFGSALWKVVRSLDPELAEKLEQNPDKAYDEVKKRVDPNYETTD